MMSGLDLLLVGGNV